MNENNSLAIIVSHNNSNELEKNLPSLAKTAGLDIIIVNNSPASPIRNLKFNRNSKLKILNSPANLGYGGGINLGIQWGLEKKYDYFVLINPDVKVAKNWLKEIIETFEKDKKIAIVQPLILLPNGKINTDGNDWHYLGFSTCRNYGKAVIPNSKFQETITKQISNSNFQTSEIDKQIAVASGACMVVKREAIQSIGYLEQNYFLYGEDSEYCFRAWKLGWKVYLSTKAQVTHSYKPEISAQKWFLLERSRLANIYSLYSIRSLIILTPVIILSEVLLIIVSTLRGNLVPKLKAYSGISLGLQTRPMRQNSQLKSEKELQEIISPDIEFPVAEKYLQKTINLISVFVYKIVKTLW